MPLPYFTAKCSFTRTTLADLSGMPRVLGDASISGILGGDGFDVWFSRHYGCWGWAAGVGMEDGCYG